MFLAVEPNFKLTSKYVQELFAFVRVGFAAAAAGFDAKKMRFHGCLAPGQKLHAYSGCRFQNFSLTWPHEARIFRCGFEEREDVCSIEASNASQRGNGGAHLAPFERAEKAHGNFRGPRHLREGQATPRAETTKALAGKRNAFRRPRNDTLTFQYMHDGRGIQPARASQKNGALQQTYIGLSVEPVAAFRTMRRNKAQRFPGAQCRRGNAHAPRHLTDAQQAAHRSIC